MNKKHLYTSTVFEATPLNKTCSFEDVIPAPTLDQAFYLAMHMFYMKYHNILDCDKVGWTKTQTSTIDYTVWEGKIDGAICFNIVAKRHEIQTVDDTN